MAHGLNEQQKEKNRGLSFGGRDNRHYLHYRSSKAGSDKWFKRNRHKRQRKRDQEIIKGEVNEN